jgi:UDP-glucose 4-epimerase
MSDTWVLVTGGTGFIGSHTCVELLNSSYKVVIVDNLSNSNISVLNSIAKISKEKPTFYNFDLASEDAKSKLITIISNHQIQAAIHFAGFKAVGESVSNPIKYFDNNLKSSLNLLSALKDCAIKRLLFSSSATVYGDSSPPFKEDYPLLALNPYGKTKLYIEEFCRDLSVSDNLWRIAILRYFNPVGAHSSAEIGEDPIGIPNNLMPYAMQVASGLREKLEIFGNDYPTNDGTCIRDYIHVVDLAKGHLAALNMILDNHFHGCEAINLGSGKGHSVLEVVSAVSKAIGFQLPYYFGSRRAGDNSSSFAEVSKAKKLLGWQTELTLEDCAIDSWRWQQKGLKQKDSHTY